MSHQTITNLSTAPVKCSHCTLWKALPGTLCVTWIVSTVAFIEPDMWPPNSPDLNPVDYAV